MQTQRGIAKHVVGAPFLARKPYAHATTNGHQQLVARLVGMAAARCLGGNVPNPKGTCGTEGQACIVKFCYAQMAAPVAMAGQPYQTFVRGLMCVFRCCHFLTSSVLRC